MALEKIGKAAALVVAKLRPHQAMELVQQETWKCTTCSAPAQENSRYCFHCELYWEDVKNGLFNQD